jgi:hypothetical protein
MTPYEAWYGRKPSVDHLRTFRCMAHVKTVTVHTSKLADRSTPMVMIGYEAGTKAYRAYNPVNKKLVVIRDVIFDEKKSWNWSSTEPVELISDEIFTVVYADDQGVGTHIAADAEDTIFGPEATSSGGGDLSPHTEAGGSGCSASPRPNGPRADESASSAQSWPSDSLRGSASASGRGNSSAASASLGDRGPGSGPSSWPARAGVRRCQLGLDQEPGVAPLESPGREDGGSAGSPGRASLTESHGATDVSPRRGASPGWVSPATRASGDAETSTASPPTVQEKRR